MDNTVFMMDRGHPRMRVQLRIALMAIALVLSGCHSHRTIAFHTAPPGEVVRLTFTDPGVDRLQEAFGFRRPQILGQVLQADEEHMVLRVRRPISAGGGVPPAGDFDFRAFPGDVSRLELRELDQRRTTAALVTGGIVFALTIYLVRVIDPGGARVIQSPDGDFLLNPSRPR